jgi:hypothetical protein
MAAIPASMFGMHRYCYGKASIDSGRGGNGICRVDEEKAL